MAGCSDHALPIVALPRALLVMQCCRAGAMGKWRISMTIMASTLAISVGIYAVGLWFCRTAPDYREEVLRQPLTMREARPGCGPALAAGHCGPCREAGHEPPCSCRSNLQVALARTIADSLHASSKCTGACALVQRAAKT